MLGVLHAKGYLRPSPVPTRGNWGWVSTSSVMDSNQGTASDMETTPDAAVPPKVTPEPAAGDQGFWGRLWQPERAKALAARAWRTNANFSRLSLRAEVTATAARRLIESPPELQKGSMLPVACELYRQAVYWSLAAHAAFRSASDDGLGADAASFAELWKDGVTVLEIALPDEVARETLGKEMQSGSFAGIWDIDGQEAADAKLAEYRDLAEALIRLSDPAMRELEALWFSRLWRVMLPLGVAVALVAGGGLAYSRSQAAQESSMSWRASSTFAPEPGCTSPSQHCANENFFVCTEEQVNPWVEFELDAEMDISRVEVTNRTDCSVCSARAIPLIVEVSTDRKSFTEVARQPKDFETWTAEFKPVRAHWVRLRVPRKTFLHLKQVRISG